VQHIQPPCQNPAPRVPARLCSGRQTGLAGLTGPHSARSARSQNYRRGSWRCTGRECRGHVSWVVYRTAHTYFHARYATSATQVRVKLSTKFGARLPNRRPTDARTATHVGSKRSDDVFGRSMSHWPNSKWNDR
jgi:hypothetical protein